MQSPRRLAARCQQVCDPLNDDLMEFGVFISEFYPVVRQLGEEAVVLVHTGGFLMEAQVWGDEQE